MNLETFKQRLNLSSVTINLNSMQFFSFENLPKLLPVNAFPIVDRTYKIVILTEGSHSELTPLLAELHMQDEDQETIFADTDVATCYFLQHGYYFSGAVPSCPKVVTSRKFVFNNFDRDFAERYGFSLSDRDYPFD